MNKNRVSLRDIRSTTGRCARGYVVWSLTNPVAAQLLNWRPVPGFEPSHEAFSASRAMIEDTRRLLALTVQEGWLDPAASDEALMLFTSVIAGIVSQQRANEPSADPAPGGFARLVDPAVSMWLKHYAFRKES